MTETLPGTTHPLTARTVITFPDRETMVRCLGSGDDTLRQVEAAFPGLSTRPRELELGIECPTGPVQIVATLFDELKVLAGRETAITPQVITQLLELIGRDLSVRPSGALTQNILSGRGRKIRPKTLHQKSYVDAIDEHTVVFGIGPAGTGKTYLAMAKAVQALQAKEVSRIILTRPAVEAGERLGYLPGTLSEKIDPYLRPLYDALHDMMDPESIPRLMEAGTIEVAPLAYMRGRTLNDAFIILDEAQNTTPEQMKMFLTRLGFGSKMVITGDVTQVDLPGSTSSGLRQVQHVLGGVQDVAFTEMTAEDVVRHELVSRIVSAYDVFDTTNRRRNERRERKESTRAARAAESGAAPEDGERA
ncbi:PhoH family protein [Kocuria oceani]|uniref:PhoH-like protein n=1 Tax=Kocuria oceani TaxID=988827 RepID=A0ABV9TL40_9MICC|nr:PhoH family protein [Kocuria oceani]